MRLTYDPVANAAYLYVVDPIERGSVATSDVATDTAIILDLDSDGRLLGLEFLSPQDQLRPETLAAAETPGPV